MKKRDKKLVFTKETIRDLTTSDSEALLQQVAGGAEATCIPGGTTHGGTTRLC
jgi:hypothetical protein